MPKYNDLELQNGKRKQYENILTDSLRIINERAKSDKHSNFYHWNFIPQIPNQFIQRFTKKWDYVVDLFIGSWTTAIECESLWRNIIWVDLNWELVERIDKLIDWNIEKYFFQWDSTKKKTVGKIKNYLDEKWRKWADLVMLHPPYFDIVKFSDKEDDLSNAKNLEAFLDWFFLIAKNTVEILKKWWYVWLVIWDKYQNSEWIPLWFYCMQKMQDAGLKLKSIIVKNMEWNRWKLWAWWIRRYRALSADYYIFKHEYVFLFKK